MDKKPLIKDYEIELCDVECVPEVQGAFYSAKARFHEDASEVMPYLNSVLRRANYGAGNRHIVWKDEERSYALRPNELAVSTVMDREHAREVVARAVAMVNDLWERRDEITPDFEVRTPPPALEIFKLLLRSNCAECGLPGCMAFAVQLSEGNRSLEECPPLIEDGNREALGALKKLGL